MQTDLTKKIFFFFFKHLCNWRISLHLHLVPTVLGEYLPWGRSFKIIFFLFKVPKNSIIGATGLSSGSVNTLTKKGAASSTSSKNYEKVPLVRKHPIRRPDRPTLWGKEEKVLTSESPCSSEFSSSVSSSSIVSCTVPLPLMNINYKTQVIK